MKDFSLFTSKTICLPQKDIDTDLIIPAEFLKTTTKEGLGKHVFCNLRKTDSNFPKFNGPRILVTGKNFGCGSSREHAPWALKDANIDVIIASEFADIFKGNAEKNGILPIILTEKTVQKFLTSGEDLSIDLKNKTVKDSENTFYSFEITDFAQKRLLENLSDMDFLMKFSTEIRRFDTKQKR
ncbi:3-isopropylmalate dehydratase small subunit [Candidatus Gracilibacteria bacterium]|nr:3-isopropylmalate dehydratase small subunit [Candidatus Gracilibacteria bacterium]